MKTGIMLLIIGAVFTIWGLSNLYKKYGALDLIVAGFIIMSLFFIGGFFIAVNQENRKYG